MLAALATAVLALASPLIGFRYESGDEWPHRDVRSSSPTILRPHSLKPVTGAPRLPRGARHVDRSPDGDTFVALDGNDLVLVDAQSGGETGRVPLGDVVDNQFWDPVLSWISPGRILVIDKHSTGVNCPPDCIITRVRVVDPVARALVGDPLRFDGDFRTARVAGRQLLVMDRFIGGRGLDSYEYPAGDPQAVIFDGAARIAHRLDLENFSIVGGLDRDLIAGSDAATGRDVAARVDVRRGTIQAQRTYGGRTPGDASATWLVPAPGRAAWLLCGCNGRGPFDRSPFAAIRPLPKDHTRILALSASGYLTRTESERNPNERMTLTYRRLDGERRWRREAYWEATVSVIGRFVYAEHVHEDGRHFTDVIRLRDGRRMAHVRGRRVLSEFSRGRSIEQVPRLEGYNSLE